MEVVTHEVVLRVMRERGMDIRGIRWYMGRIQKGRYYSWKRNGFDNMAATLIRILEAYPEVLTLMEPIPKDFK
jgi:hypothetical protein